MDLGLPDLDGKDLIRELRGWIASPMLVLSSRVRFGNVAVDLASHEVTRDGQPVHLTPIQFRLLTSLIRGHGKVLTHKRLLHEIWGAAYSDRAHYLRVYMM